MENFFTVIAVNHTVSDAKFYCLWKLHGSVAQSQKFADLGERELINLKIGLE